MEPKSFLDEHQKNILNNLPGVVFRYQRTSDGQDRLLHVSQAAEHIWGFSATAAMQDNHRVWTRYDKADLAAHQASIQASADTLSPWFHEWRYHHPDGSLRWHQGRGQPQRLSDGSTIWDSIVMDITEQKQTEGQLTQTLRNLNERMKEQRCLYAVARLNEQNLSTEALLQEAVRLITAGFDAPESTVVCLHYAGQSYSNQPLPNQPAVLQACLPAGPHVLLLQIFVRPTVSLQHQVFLPQEAELVQTLAELLALKLERCYKNNLLSVLADTHQLLLHQVEMAQMMPACLALIGESLELERVYAIELLSGQAQTVYKQTYLWTKQSQETQGVLPVSAFSAQLPVLRENQAFVSAVAALPPGELQNSLQAHGIQTLLLLPLCIQGRFYGWMGFETLKQRQQWPQEEERFLRSLAYSLARTLASQDADQQMKQAYLEKVAILESISEGFFAVDHDFTVTYWNQKAEILLHTHKNLILHQNLWDVFSDAIGSEAYQRYYQALSTQEPQHFETYYEVLNAWFEVSAYPSELGLSVYFKDIGKRKATEKQLIAMNQDLQTHVQALAASNHELEQFAYIASHDLQEPLRMISSFLGQLEKKYGNLLDERGKRYIFFAVDGAQRMRQIILDLLEYSRVSRPEQNPLEAVDFNTLLEEICLLLRKKIQESGAQIQWHALPVLRTARIPMRQLVLNLISNALKYVAHGTCPQIEITAEEQATEWVFAVRDNGIGIEAAYFDKIFIIFQRLHSKEDYSGTGMGLAICKKIIENLGGRIWLESEYLQGSTFYFSIRKE